MKAEKTIQSRIYLCFSANKECSLQSAMNSTFNPGPLLNTSCTGNTTAQLDEFQPAMNSTPNPGLLLNTSCTGNTTAQLDEYLESLNDKMATELLPTIIMLGLIAVFGSIGNTITLIVYCKRFKPCSMRIYIITLSVLDLMCNILVIPSEILDMRFSMTSSYPGLCRAMKTYMFFIPIMSVFTLVQVALDRRRKILTPFAYKTFTKQTKRSLVWWGIVAGIISVLNVIVHGQHSVTTDNPCVKGWACGMDDAFIQTSFPLVCSIFNGLVFLVCFVVITASYVQIVNKIAQHKRQVASPKALPTGCGLAVSSNEGNSFESEKGVQKNSDNAPRFGRSEKDPQPEVNIIASDVSDVIESEEQLKTAKKSDLKGKFPPDVERYFGCGDAGTASSMNNFRDIAMEIEMKFSKLHKESTENENQTHSTQLILPSLFTSKSLTSSSLPSNQTNPSEDSNNSENISITNINSLSNVNISCTCEILPSYRFSSINRENACDVTMTSTQAWRLSPKKIPNRATGIMFILSVTLMVSFVPHYTMCLLEAAHFHAESGLAGWKLNMLSLSFRSIFINSLVNPFIYSLFSERFRSQCRQLFCNFFVRKKILNAA